MQWYGADLILLLQLFLELLNILAEGVLGTLQLGDHGFPLFKLPAHLGYVEEKKVPVLLTGL